MSAKSIPAGVVLIGAIVLTAGCDKGRATQQDTAGASTTEMVMEVDPRVKKLVIDSSHNASDADSLPFIFGYNDAQKLPATPAAKDWGPLVRLYALKRDYDSSAFMQKPNGAMVAVMRVDPEQHMPTTYRHLGIENSPTDTLVYCVFLQLDTTRQPAKQWQAGTSPITAGKCENPKKMDVDADDITESGLTQATDFPKYAVRFMQDTTGAPSIGVRCVFGVCEIGNKKGSSHPNLPGSSGKAGKIRTWRDEQHIADSLPNQSGFWRGPLAAVTPVENLAAMKDEFRSADGAQAATITVVGPAPIARKYNGWGLAANSSTEIWLKVFEKVGADSVWMYRMRTNGTYTSWVELNRTPHHDGLVPGTARWVWDPKDEGIWMACDQGCCEFGLSDDKNHPRPAAPPPDSAKGKPKAKK